MTEETVKYWLAEYAALSSDEFPSYASSVNHHLDLINAIYTVLEDRQKYNELIDPVCTTLFEFYRSSREELKRFTLIFLPTLIYVYLNAVAQGEKKSCRGVEALLLGLYNLEAVDENGQAQNVSFRLPSLAQSSIYHEASSLRCVEAPPFAILQELLLLKPMSLAPASLTENALRRLEECNTKLVRWGPLSQIEKILSQNRASVMTALLFIYNQHISSLEKHCLDQLCRTVSKLVTQGFSKPGKRVSYSSDMTRVLPRIPTCPKFLLEIIQSLYYSVFNGDCTLALQAVGDVHHRACYQGFSEVLLVTNAIKNSTPHIHSGLLTDNPMGISLAISPQTTTNVMSKSMITNASFRTKKLPDDIPIQVSRGPDGDNALGSITEEKEETGNGTLKEVNKDAPLVPKEGSGEAPPRRSLPKMAVSFGKKTRERLKTTKSRLVNGGDDQQQLQGEELNSEIGGGPGDEIIEQVRTMQVSSV